MAERHYAVFADRDGNEFVFRAWGHGSYEAAIVGKITTTHMAGELGLLFRRIAAIDLDAVPCQVEVRKGYSVVPLAPASGAERGAVSRRIDVLRAQLEVVCLLAGLATEGPWDSRDGAVIAPDVPADAARVGTDVVYYGGDLVCESVGRADALLIVAARNLMPEIARAFLATEHRATRAEQREAMYRYAYYEADDERVGLRAEKGKVEKRVHALANEVMRLRFLIQVLEENPTFSVREAKQRAGIEEHDTSYRAVAGAGV